jgi:diguanylate cyclase (GGDEF)-like protein
MRPNNSDARPLLPSMSISRLAATLNFLVIVGILAMAGVAGLPIEKLRIGGEEYDAIVGAKDLIADVLPPPLYVIEAFQEATQLENAPEHAASRIETLRALRAKYEERRAFWAAAADLPEEIKRKLIVDSDREAQRFWTEIERRFLPAALSGDRDQMRDSFAKIRAAFDAHHKIVDEIVASTGAFSERIETTAATAARRYVFLMLATTLLALGVVIFALRALHTRVTDPLIALATFMNRSCGAESVSEVPFIDRKDEIGVVARAVAAFRSNVEARVLEAKNIELDAALNNIVQGLEMFDADGRLALCNARYRQIYGLREERLALGATLAQAVALRVEAGLLSREESRWLMDRIEHARSDAGARQFNCMLADGRCIAISVQPMGASGGFVATHQDVTEQRRSEARIAYLAHHDRLTGLPNRMWLKEQLGEALDCARRGDLVAVHALDLEHFRSVNDSLGHQIGDALLATAAERLKRGLRDTDIVGRVGGDEFVIVERPISEPADAAALANRVIEILGEPFDIAGQRVVIGASVGVAVFPQDGATGEELMRNADLALDRAKADGCGVVRFFERAMDAQMQARARLERGLRNALENSELTLHYQPIVNARDASICGFEALLRWRHPEEGLIPPTVFIPLAERTGLIVPIGAWVLQEACAAAARWPAHLSIAVNLSAAQFRSGDIGRTVQDALERSGLAATRLELEITESLLLEGDEDTRATLHRLRNIGARIAMDDFGTGYSSLSYLQSFPFDRIKIDRSFVQAVDVDGRSLTIVRAITNLANALGMRTTAEGVEEEGQLEALRSEGCTEIQGYLMSKPLPLPEVEKLLRSRAANEAAPGDAAPSLAGVAA